MSFASQPHGGSGNEEQARDCKHRNGHEPSRPGHIGGDANARVRQRSRYVNVNVAGDLQREHDRVDIAAVREQPHALIGFSDRYASEKTALKQFLRENLYRHPRVSKMMGQAQNIVSKLFEHYLDDYQRMPTEHADRVPLRP